jgi:glutamate 5-kinase
MTESTLKETMVYKNEQNHHRPTKTSLTIVIKVGTSSICDEKTHYPLLGNLSRIVETIVLLKEQNHRVVLVTSAAVGTGLRRLNLKEKPKRQALVQVQPYFSFSFPAIKSFSCM